MNSEGYSNELYHYQVKGAKHGVRRYQNMDGSLTPLGRIHYGIGVKNNKQAKKLADKKKAEREKAGKQPTKNEKLSDTAANKKISKISDADLEKYTSRLKKESELVSARLDLAKAQHDLKKYMHTDYVEKPKSKWKRTLIEDVLIPTVTDVGKDYLKKVAKEALGLPSSNSSDKGKQNSNQNKQKNGQNN